MGVSSLDVSLKKGEKVKTALPSTEEEREFEDMITSLTSAFSTVNSKKTEEAIENARKRWGECLKAANGDLEKAERLYDQV